MDAVHEAHFAVLAGHYNGRGTRAVAEETHAFHESAVGYAGRGEDDVASRSKILGAVDLFLVFDAHLGYTFFQLRFVDHQPGEDLAVEAAHGGRSNHALGGSADPHYGMDARPQDGGGDAGGEIAVTDQADAGSGFANIVNQLLVTRPIKHDYHQIAHVAAKAACNGLQVLRRRRVQVHYPFAGGAYHQLFHVAIRR